MNAEELRKKREEEWRKSCEENDRALRQMLPWIPLMILAVLVLAPIVAVINIWQAIEQWWKIRQMPTELLERKLLEYGLLHQQFKERFPNTTRWLERCRSYAREYERRQRR